MYRLAKITLALVIAVSIMFFVASRMAPTQAEAMQTYIVLYKQQAVPANAADAIAKAGGTLVYSYDQIGVVIARSDSASFRDKLLQDKRIENASSTAGFAYKLDEEIQAFAAATGPPPGNLSNAPAAFNDPLSYLQWDMRQIHVPEALAITGGSPDVVVGDIDTGLDYTHPDLAANVDFANSVSCVSGVPNQDPAAWNDDNGHGTHTAGTIAAASNDIGIVGVAPNVKIAAIKAGNADGYFFPEAVICSFMWAGDRRLDVTNNSYYADPYLFNCRNDPVQHAIWKAEQRAIRYAMQQGVTVVAAAGNENGDLAHPTIDTTSPDYPPGSEITRTVTNACVVIPVEIPGVIGVSANGSLLQKSYYSNYGVGVIQVVAPGGDRRFQQTPDDARGYVLSTFPGGYALAQGTSMASPHVAGVAALVISQFGKMPPGKVQAFINQTADPQPCPPNPFDPGGTGAWLATCQGGDSYNSFYGHGQVNALNAVTHKPGK
jgi:subtilisin family serine protease